MAKQQLVFEWESFLSDSELTGADRQLLQEARSHTQMAYAPYSKFLVAAVARTETGKMVKGTNQENASYPVGICAERVLLSALSSVCPDETVEAIAISYHSLSGSSNNPASPCGICRQSLLEFEVRNKRPMRLILSGQQGPVWILHSASDLLPLGFTPDDLKR